MDIRATMRLNTGRSMPAIGLGTWELTEDTAGAVENALGLGYPMIDTSGDYGTQPGIGQAIRRSHVDRDDIFLVTKVEEDEDAYQATVKNLGELGLDYADLMLIHRPPESGVGKDLWEGLVRAREDGLTKDIGVSNYSIQQIQDLVDATGEVPTVNQIEWTPFGRSEEMFEYCREKKIIIQAYSPLTRGKRLEDKRLVDIADEYGKTPAQILIRWNLQLGTAPLPKANRPSHQEEILGAFDFELSNSGMMKLNERNEMWSSLGRSLQYA